MLNEVFRQVRIAAAVFCRLECADPWGVTIGPGAVGYFHILTHGRCRLELLETRESVEIGAGDVVLLPRGHPHTLCDDPSSPAPLLRQAKRPPTRASVDAYPILRRGPDGPTSAAMICGGLTFEDGSAKSLLGVLPPMLHLRVEADRTGPWLGRTLRLVEREVLTPTPGSNGVVTRLCEVLFLQAVRVFFARLAPGQGGWLGGLKDPRISRAIARMLREPERSWSVPELAAAVSMSRSGFAGRFRELTGETPMAFLRTWRLRQAADLLRRSDFGTDEVARRVGYRSTAAFARAFKEQLGAPPAGYRVANRSDASLKSGP